MTPEEIIQNLKGRSDDEILRILGEYELAQQRLISGAPMTIDAPPSLEKIKEAATHLINNKTIRNLICTLNNTDAAKTDRLIMAMVTVLTAARADIPIQVCAAMAIWVAKTGLHSYCKDY